MCGKWEEIICDEINDGVIDGAALLICDSKHFFPQYAGGEITDGMVMSCDRIIDIASVSKAVMTVMELLFCRSRGMVGFDAPFPGCSVTVRDLALHISGFCQKKQLKCLYLAEEDRGEQLRNSLHFPAAKTHRVYLLELSVARTDRRRNHGAVFDEVLSHATFRVAWCDGFIARAAWDHRFRSAHTNLWNEGTGRARGFRRFPHLSRRWLRGEIPGCFHDTEPREFPLDFVLWRPTCLREKVFSENFALRTHRQCNVAASACTMQFRLGQKRCTSSRIRVCSDYLSFRRVRSDSLSASISGSDFVR